MSTIPDASPSTIDGIKRKAKSVGRQNRIPHLMALDAVAQQSGYENFHHARRSLQRTDGAPPRHSIFISAYWRDTSTMPASAGLEVLEIKLPRPLMHFLTKHQCSYARNLEGFFIEYSDHLEMRSNTENQEGAKERLIRAALALQFIEATGLRPVTNQLQRSMVNKANELPSTDHASRWVSEEASHWLVLDEPYEHVTDDSEFEARDTWVAANDLHWARLDWHGLYNPGETVPHFLTNNPDLLNKMVAVVEDLSDDALKFEGEWRLQTDSYYGQFVSPARKSEGKKRKPRPGTTYRSSSNAVEFHWRPGYLPRQRPAQVMSMSNHKKLGRTLQCLHVSATPDNAYQRLSRLQSELEDWMYAEYSNERSKKMDLHAYYGARDIQGYRGPKRILSAVDRLRSVLIESYPDCKPLRDQLRNLDTARLQIVNMSS
jgi:hypothetical protein